jgi:hypothetical protein
MRNIIGVPHPVITEFLEALGINADRVISFNLEVEVR